MHWSENNIMAERIYIKNLLRKGQAVARHPLLRDGAVEAIKASQIGTDSEPTWLTPATVNLERYRTGKWG